jgi:C1A family cysteine protease
MPKHAYGWRRQLPDIRDRKFAWKAPESVPAVPVDLRPNCPSVYDQEQLGSCTANSVAGVMEFDMMRQGLKPAFTPSRLFIYWNERSDQGDTDDDTGATIRESIKAANTYGACDEALWPYVIAQFAARPPQSCYDAAKSDLVLKYQAVDQSLDGVRSVLQAGLPVLIGFAVYESFESDEVAKTGIVPMPGPNESMLGGHAVHIVGDQPDQRRFILRNSWGVAWGAAGYFYMPYDYVLNSDLASDFWAAQLVGAQSA